MNTRNLISGQETTTWAKFRAATWEEDISRNHCSNQPFQNSVSPSEMPREEFNILSHVTPQLLGDETLDSFLQRDIYPMPSTEDREGYNKNNNAAYFLNGLADYLKIQQVIRRYQLRLNSYLDFGCASGRVLRHFCAHSNVPVLWGSDINGRHIRFLNDYLPPKLKIIHNHAIPNLQIADNSLDLISAFSVFTHIDTFETAWLAELYRILKPDGLVYLTVQNDASWKFIQEAPDEQAIRARMKSQIPDFDAIIKQDLPDQRLDFRYTNVGPYRAQVFHSDRYLRRTWGRFFDIAEIIPLHHGAHQSVLIGRKRS